MAIFGNSLREKNGSPPERRLPLKTKSRKFTLSSERVGRFLGRAPRMKKKKQRSYSVYLGGELFSLKHLIGNAWLAEAIYEKSQGRFHCLLPQDFSELRGRSSRAIRDTNFRALVASDLAL